MSPAPSATPPAYDRTPRRRWWAAVGLVGAVVLSLAACSSGGSKKSDDGHGSSTSSTAGSSVTTVAASGGDKAEACSTIDKLISLNNSIGSGSDLATGRRALAEAVDEANQLQTAAPAAVSSAAATYAETVRVLKNAADNVSSMDELHSKARSDQKLVKALSDLSSSGATLEKWRKDNC